MTQEDRDKYVAAIRLLLGDKSEHEIKVILNNAFPSWVVLSSHQYYSLRQALDDLSGKAQLLRASLSP